MTSPREVTVRVDDVYVSYDAITDAGAGVKGLFGGRRRAHRRVQAVQGVSFEIHEGESIGIIGSNGSGKSTLLAAMTGLLPVESGEVWVRSRPTLLGVGAVMRPALSGRRNITIGGLALGLSLAEVHDLEDEIIDFSGLADSIDLPMRAYSSGMRARLMFAIATSTIPDILLIDEALAVGDAEFFERSQRRIDAIRGEAGAVVLVSHNNNEIRQSCDRVVWLDQGQVVDIGDPDDVIEAYEERVRTRIAEQVTAPKPMDRNTVAPTPLPRPAASSKSERTVTFLIGSNHTTLPIQRYLSTHEADLSAAGVSVPSFLGLRSHHAFGAAAFERAAQVLPVDTGPDWQAWRDDFVAHAKTEMDDGHDWVASSELFANLMGPRGAIGLRHLADELGFGHARAVLYVQRQDRLAARTHIESVVAGNRAPFDVDAEVGKVARYDWRRLCEWWGNPDAFDDFVVRLYPRDGETDVVTDFATALSLPLVDPEPLLGQPTLSDEAVAFVMELTHPDATDGANRATISRAARTLATTTAEPFQLTRDESDRLMRAFAEPNAWVLDRVDADARDDHYFDPDPDLPTERRPLGLEDTLRFAGRLARQPIG